MDDMMLESFVDELAKIGMSTKDVKTQIAKPPTGDTGPAGKGKNDPRFKAQTGRGFEKKGEMDTRITRLLDTLKSR